MLTGQVAEGSSSATWLLVFAGAAAEEEADAETVDETAGSALYDTYVST